MSISITERETIWDDFLEAWPLERLLRMSLGEYAEARSKECFTYWIEARTESLGSVWGGSAFKFGIFGRRDPGQKDGDQYTRYGATHAWATKYGNTEEEAFNAVRKLIVRVAQAARTGEFQEIEKVDLGPVVKWKIAFLYQDRQKPSILCILNARDLSAALGRFASGKESMAALQVEARRLFNQPNILDAYDAAWDARTAWVKQHTLSELILTDIEKNPEQFELRHTTQRMVGARLKERGLSFAFSRDDKAVTLFAPAGTWTESCSSLIKREYRANETRHSNLSTCCPEAAQGSEAVALKLASMEDYDRFVTAYSGQVLSEPEDVVPEADMDLTSNAMPSNQVLFGPPGTGKTHATIDEALRILDPELVNAQTRNPDMKDARAKLKARFDELKAEGRLVFVTFHQSFSYEDFVEGIRAVPPDGTVAGQTGITYRVEDGVFLSLCESARRNRRLDEQAEIREDATVWKMSIGEANGETATRRYCFDHDEARIGWNKTGDLNSPTLNLASSKLGLGPKEQASLENFSKHMEPGDVVVCLSTKRSISAVGVVTGPYAYDPEPPAPVREDYVQRLPVKWLWRDIQFDIVNLNGGKQLTLQTVYALNRIRWPDLYDALVKAGHKPRAELAKVTQAPLPHVVIIDEINRGNVSRIFGELITLIEDTKRDGQPEALSVTLPYSRRPFSIPSNVHLIATMNSADRSLASLDVALRRRFTFKPMPPQPALLSNLLIAGRIPMQDLLSSINLRIEALLGPDFLLGHAWFIPLKDDKRIERLADIFRRQVIPQLQEYFFDDWERIRWVLNDHRKGTRQEYCFIRKRQGVPESLLGEDVQVSVRPLWEVNTNAFLHIGTYLSTIDMSCLEDEA